MRKQDPTGGRGIDVAQKQITALMELAAILLGVADHEFFVIFQNCEQRRVAALAVNPAQNRVADLQQLLVERAVAGEIERAGAKDIALALGDLTQKAALRHRFNQVKAGAFVKPRFFGNLAQRNRLAFPVGNDGQNIQRAVDRLNHKAGPFPENLRRDRRKHS